jgi:methylated-DNA-protein-cysteine methyltransferase related protein
MTPDHNRTPLVIAVARAIRQVPRGRVSTYGAIAQAAGYPRCSRHVARVLNLIPGLPWQRILGSGGRISLTGEGAMEQRFLLEAEGVRFRGRRVDLAEFEHSFVRKAVKRSPPVEPVTKQVRRKS